MQITPWILTLCAPALQSYVIWHTHVRQKFHFSKIFFLPWLTIVLHRITKENLYFSPKKARGCYNSPLIMCYPLFASSSKFIYSKTTNWWRIQQVHMSIMYHSFLYRKVITLVYGLLTISYVGKKILSQNVQLSITFQLISNQ